MMWIQTKQRWSAMGALLLGQAFISGQTVLPAQTVLLAQDTAPTEPAPAPEAPANELLEDLPGRMWDWVTAISPTVWVIIILVLIALIVLRRLLTGITRSIRRRRPPKIHPHLQKYSVDRAEVQRQQQEAARQIVATSTGNRLAGYRIVRQIDAVFVEGYATPDEAIVALKAAAAERGANAILNVSTDRTVTGRCSASGDAIFVAPFSASSRPPSPPSGPKK